ncbi:MAG: carboxypeptidase regulatory-like domain-containing protein [Streptomyces sp.]|uniref:carboxypeptidase-like regulatory domain-containing protein n=1 Tax=Streptomyces sp. TaxID=1931 RepID=UPI0025F87EAB|nr:carboxypeptidase-like regulatory domain-containing protein [Streptomyces sp.]MBW8792396.1 carboxypeptidase regulatory-like domain-containing protein [Streptomyces sp.]
MSDALVTRSQPTKLTSASDSRPSLTRTQSPPPRNHDRSQRQPLYRCRRPQSPGIINAPGIGQGGIIVNAGAANATVTWTGPVNHSETADVSGRLAVGGLPDGNYTVISSYSGCNPGVATATVTAGIATSIDAHVIC